VNQEKASSGAFSVSGEIMSVHKFEAPYGLVFNLDQYTANYERNFCAFVIGKFGQCGVGEDMAELYEEDHPKGTPFWALGDRCSAQPDDNGCYRPVSIYYDRDVDKNRYESLIIFFDTLPEDDEIEMVIARAKNFCSERPDWKSYQGEKRPLTLRGVHLISNKVERVIKIERQFEIS
jgi:hypothetical protein